ncbi:serine/arginine repetitive matrix protein 1-like [Sturnira hondurensis]|uniref:serine/arginine repetitive matrix protein 1-like n=1 Tax=Sturnira hondurensis TaxID=192404 RepID=UPI00187A2B10|nr:serine/arginine repetitive matrix protein 1-like [Sturnira hondurensis]
MNSRWKIKAAGIRILALAVCLASSPHPEPAGGAQAAPSQGGCRVLLRCSGTSGAKVKETGDPGQKKQDARPRKSRPQKGPPLWGNVLFRLPLARDRRESESGGKTPASTPRRKQRERWGRGRPKAQSPSAHSPRRRRGLAAWSCSHSWALAEALRTGGEGWESATAGKPWESEALNAAQSQRGPREAPRHRRDGRATGACGPRAKPGPPPPAPAPAPSKTSLPTALRELLGVPGQDCTGNPSVPPPGSQPSLASGKEKGAFPRPDPSFQPPSPQRRREISLCSLCVTDTSSPWERTSPCRTDRETEALEMTKIPTGSQAIESRHTMPWGSVWGLGAPKSA